MLTESVLRKKEKRIQRKLILRNLRKREMVITDEEVDFFRQYPEELEDMTSTLRAKKLYLNIAALLGLLLVALSVIFRYNPMLSKNGSMIHAFLTDLTFEGGVSLWGAAITVYILEIVLDNQNQINEAYREAIRKRIYRKLDQENSP